MVIIEDKILIWTLADIYFKPHNIQGFPRPPGFSVADDIEDRAPDNLKAILPNTHIVTAATWKEIFKNCVLVSEGRHNKAPQTVA